MTDEPLPDDLLPEEELGIDVDEFADELPTDETVSTADAPAAFDAGPDLHALDDLNFEGRVGVLERLGPAHFRSKGFSFMGFLQTVYEHVAGEVKGVSKEPEA